MRGKGVGEPEEKGNELPEGTCVGQNAGMEGMWVPDRKEKEETASVLSG